MDSSQTILPVINHRDESLAIGSSSKAKDLDTSKKSTVATSAGKPKAKRARKATRRRAERKCSSNKKTESESTDDSQNTASSADSQVYEVASEGEESSMLDEEDSSENGSTSTSSDSDGSITVRKQVGKSKRPVVSARAKVGTMAKRGNERAALNRNRAIDLAALGQPQSYRTGYEPDSSNGNLSAQMHLLDNKITQLSLQLNHPHLMGPRIESPQLRTRPMPATFPPPGIPRGIQVPEIPGGMISDNLSIIKQSKQSRPKNSSKGGFKRVDDVWDSTRYTYRLRNTCRLPVEAELKGYIFHVRRTFDHNGKYRSTVVDIKSKLLRECLQDVIGNVRGLSLVDEVPKLDPNTLFL